VFRVVEFVNESSLKTALRELNDQELKGKRILLREGGGVSDKNEHTL
jgi:RNA recognition motif-containing protein